MLLLMTHFPDRRNLNRYAFYNTDRCRRKREWGRQRTVRTLEAEDRLCIEAAMHGSLKIITLVITAVSARPVSLRLLWETGVLSIIPAQICLLFYSFFPVALRSNAGHGLLILEVSKSHKTTHHSRQDSSGRVITSSQRPLPYNTQHSQHTYIHAPGGIRTQDLSKRAAVDLRLRPCGHWVRNFSTLLFFMLFSGIFANVAGTMFHNQRSTENQSVKGKTNISNESVSGILRDVMISVPT